MADINVFGALYDNALEARVFDSMYEQVALLLKVGNDSTTLFLTVADIEHLFGTINNYLESKQAPKPTINDLVKMQVENA